MSELLTWSHGVWPVPLDWRWRQTVEVPWCLGKKQMGMDFLYDLRDALQSNMCWILRCYVGRIGRFYSKPDWNVNSCLFKRVCSKDYRYEEGSKGWLCEKPSRDGKRGRWSQSCSLGGSIDCLLLWRGYVKRSVFINAIRWARRWTRLYLQLHFRYYRRLKRRQT